MMLQNDLYVGESGKLNAALFEGRLNKVRTLTRVGAREVSLSKIKDDKKVIYAGRYLLNGIEQQIGSKLLYLSTYIYNSFVDSYQLGKLDDEAKCNATKAHVVRIPFIDEFMPVKLKARYSEKATNKYIYVTDLQKIEECLIDFLESKEALVKLHIEKKYLKFTMLDRFNWVLFSSLYTFVSKIKKQKVKINVLLILKALEKLTLKLTSSHGVSCVFIAGK